MLGHARGINPEVEYREGDLRSVRLGRRFAAVLLHDASAYLTRTPDGAVAADYVMFTPRQQRPDPCEKMRQGKP